MVNKKPTEKYIKGGLKIIARVSRQYFFIKKLVLFFNYCFNDILLLFFYSYLYFIQDRS